MERRKVPYEVSSGGVLLTRCEMTGVLIGSLYCMQCRSYESKNRQEHFVVCNNRTMQTRRSKTKKV